MADTVRAKDERIVPTPPLSVVRHRLGDKRNPRVKRDVGRVFWIGYYSPQDGLDCVWFVNEVGVRTDSRLRIPVQIF